MTIASPEGNHAEQVKNRANPAACEVTDGPLRPPGGSRRVQDESASTGAELRVGLALVTMSEQVCIGSECRFPEVHRSRSTRRRVTQRRRMPS